MVRVGLSAHIHHLCRNTVVCVKNTELKVQALIQVVYSSKCILISNQSKKVGKDVSIICFCMMLSESCVILIWQKLYFNLNLSYILLSSNIHCVELNQRKTNGIKKKILFCTWVG